MTAANDVEKIVSWLRNSAGQDATDLRKLHKAKMLTGAQTKDWESLIETKVGIADAIERGDWQRGASQ